MPTITLPPHSDESERALLGCLMLDPNALDEVRQFLKPDHFYNTRNAQTYAVIMDLGPDADLLTVSERMDREFFSLDGPSSEHLAALMAEVPTGLNATAYARTVHDRAARRDLLNAASAIAKLAYDIAQPLDDVIRGSARALNGEAWLPAQVMSWSQHVGSAYEDLAAQISGQAGALADFGIPLLDDTFGGFVRGDIDIISGESGTGKTAVFSHAMAHWHRTRQRPRVLICSQEMTAAQFLPRVASNVLRLNLSRASIKHHGERLAASLPAVSDVLNKLMDIPVMFVDRPGLTVGDIAHYTRKHKADIVLIDYLQLMDTEAGRSEREDQAVRRVMNRLLAIAKPTADNRGCCIAAISQVNRAGEGLRALLGGQALGNVAVNVVDLQPAPKTSDERDAAYRYEGDTETHVYVTPIDFSITKARYGRKDKTQVKFVGAHQRFVRSAPVNTNET